MRCFLEGRSEFLNITQIILTLKGLKTAVPRRFCFLSLGRTCNKRVCKWVCIQLPNVHKVLCNLLSVHFHSQASVYSTGILFICKTKQVGLEFFGGSRIVLLRTGGLGPGFRGIQKTLFCLSLQTPYRSIKRFSCSDENKSSETTGRTLHLLPAAARRSRDKTIHHTLLSFIKLKVLLLSSSCSIRAKIKSEPGATLLPYKNFYSCHAANISGGLLFLSRPKRGRNL